MGIISFLRETIALLSKRAKKKNQKLTVCKNVREKKKEKRNYDMRESWREEEEEEEEGGRALTLFDTLEPDGVFAVFDHSMDVPGGEPGHRGVVDFQQEFILEEFTAVAHGSAREKLADNRELSILSAALQLQPQLPLLIPAKDTLVDFVSPVVLPLLQALGHGSPNNGRNHMSAAVEEVSVAGRSKTPRCHR